MESIQATFELNEENMLSGAKLFIKYGSPGISILDGIIVIGVVAVVAQLIWYNPERMNIVIPLALLAIVGTYHRLRMARTILNNAKKSPQFGLPVSVTFTSDRFHSNCPGSDGEFAYSFLAKYRDTADGLLLYFDSTQFLWIPRKAFSSAEEHRQAVQWLEQGQSQAETQAPSPFPMNDPQAVHASYVWNFKACYDAMVAFQRARSRFRWAKWLLRVAGALSLIAAISSIIVSPQAFNVTQILMPIFFIVLSFYTEVLSLFGAAFVRATPAYRQTLEYYFDEIGYRVRRKGVQSEGGYETLQESVTLKNGFLLFYQPMMFDWLPRSSLKDPEAYQRLALWLGQKTKNRLIR